jgi:hypothetical protein
MNRICAAYAASFVDDDDRLTIGLDCKGSFLKRFNMKEVTILIIHGA